MSFTSLKIFSFVGKSIQDFKNHAGFQVKFHHAWITFEYLETIPQIYDHGHIFDFVCVLFQFFRAFYIIVLGIYMYMLFVIQQNNIYCICSVFAYIFSDNEFVR